MNKSETKLSTVEQQAHNNQQKHTGTGGVIKVIAGNGSYVALGFLANLISANGLSPAGFGMVSLALAMLNVLQEICGSGIDMAMVRLAAPHIKSCPEKAHQYYKAALQLKLLVNGLVALLLWLNAFWFATMLYSNAQMLPFIHWVAIGLLGAAIYNYMLARFQTEERFSLYASLRVINNVFKLIILGILWGMSMFTPQNVMAAWMSTFLLSFGIALLFTSPSKVKTGQLIRIEPRYWQDLFDFGKWVVASSFLFTLYSRTDLLILGRYASTEVLGQYAAAWNITFVIDLLTYSIIIALLPRAVRIINYDKFIKYIKSTLLICLSLAILLLPLFFLSDWLFALFFPKYMDSAEIFRILFVGAIITLLFHPVYLILYARNKVSRLTLVNFSLVIFCTLFGFIFIPEYGAVGAAWVIVGGRVFASTLICYFVYLELRNVLKDEAAFI